MSVQSGTFRNDLKFDFEISSSQEKEGNQIPYKQQDFRKIKINSCSRDTKFFTGTKETQFS